MSSLRTRLLLSKGKNFLVPIYLILFLLVYTWLVIKIVQHELATSIPKSLHGIHFYGETKYMDGLAIAANTDKSSRHHNYTRVYPKYFAAMRQKPITMLEFGIYMGHSAKMWEQYFPNAKLHFVDITDKKVWPPWSAPIDRSPQPLIPSHNSQQLR
jgi:hypothetical protein